MVVELVKILLLFLRSLIFVYLNFYKTKVRVLCTFIFEAFYYSLKETLLFIKPLVITSLSAGSRRRWLFPQQGNMILSTKVCPRYDSKLHLMVRLKIWRYRAYGLALFLFSWHITLLVEERLFNGLIVDSSYLSQEN